MGCEPIGTQLSSGLCGVETEQGQDIINNEGEVVAGPHEGQRYFLSEEPNHYLQGQRIAGDVIQTGDYRGHEIGGPLNSDQLQTHYACMPTHDANGSQIALSPEEIANIERSVSAVPGQGGVRLDPAVSQPRVCVNIGGNGAEAGALIQRQLGSLYGYSPACLALFDTARGNEAREALCGEYVDNLRSTYLGAPTLLASGDPPETFMGEYGAWILGGVGSLLSAWGGLEAIAFIFGYRTHQWTALYQLRAAAARVAGPRAIASRAAEYVLQMEEVAQSSTATAEAAATEGTASTAGRSLLARAVSGVSGVLSFLAGTVTTLPLVVAPECEDAGNDPLLREGLCGGGVERQIL